MEIEYKCVECGNPKFVPEMHEVGRCHCSGELEEVEQDHQTDAAKGSTVLPGCMATKFIREETGPQRYGLVFGYGREKYYFERHEVRHISRELLSVIEKWENE